jgi:hypothetical protein
MLEFSRLFWLVVGMLLGVGATVYLTTDRKIHAAANDRFEDFILCTGPVNLTPNVPTDGVWLLDYRTGKLLGTVIDRLSAKIINWAEVDLVTELGLQAKQNVHFLMTTGTITHGQAALYIAETTTGRFGVYTMGPRPDGKTGIAIRRHDLSMFRQVK